MGLKTLYLVVLVFLFSAGTAFGGGCGDYSAPCQGYCTAPCGGCCSASYGGYYSRYRGYYTAPYPYCCSPELYQSWYIAQTNQEINDIIRSTYEYRQRVMDRVSRQWSDYIRGDYSHHHRKHK
ncbi:MAG: hypothetical protein AB9866_23315 [Syntrophobacteraceae bacterium]